jgi:glycosyltransferase involved in cell wall biosynthesis
MDTPHRPIILHVLHSLEGGGTERTLAALLRAFDHRSFAHVVIPLRDAGSLSARLPDPVSCRPMGVAGRARTLWIRLGGMARSLRASVIHARNTGCWYDATMARLLCPRTKLVLGFHGLEDAGAFRLAQRRKARLGLRLGASFTSVSATGVTALRVQAGVPPHRIALLRNGVDIARFEAVAEQARADIRRTLGFMDENLVIGTVGSLTPVKRHDLLLEATASLLPRYPHLRLLVVGEGPLDRALRQQAANAGLRNAVVFAGQREDIPQVLSAMDVYVCGSASEGMSNALLEAMASSRAIVATNVGDNARMLRDGVDGRLIDQPCASQLEAAIEELVMDESLMRRFAVSARERARRFDLRQAVEDYEDYYRMLLEPTSPRRDRAAQRIGLELPSV